MTGWHATATPGLGEGQDSAAPTGDGTSSPTPNPHRVSAGMLPAERVAPRLHGPILLAAGSGMRQGEALGLGVDHLEFLRRRVKVVEQLFTPDQGQPFLKRLKSKNAERTIPLPGSVLAGLSAHVAAFPPVDGLVFTNSLGRPWRRPRFVEAFARVVAEAGLVDGDGKPLFTFHDLRHFYASVLIASGSSVKVVQKRLGHASAIETLHTYGHLWPDEDDDHTREVVEAAFKPTTGRSEQVEADGF